MARLPRIVNQVGALPPKRDTRRRLAISLKLAIGSLGTNIRKLENTGASPLLVAARKKRLVRMKEELARLAKPKKG